MCRLFGFRSEEPVSVREPLLAESGSLRTQSSEHKDGWGIAYFDADQPRLAHGLAPAHQDPQFDRIAAALTARTVIAHVRLASIGAVHLRNAHPFVRGSWVFAHNGTVREFVVHQPELEAAIAPELRQELKGETDSERCFLLFLTQLRALTGPDRARASVEQVARAVAITMRRVGAITDRPGVEPSSLNFLVTDGQLMVASRRGKTLFSAGTRDARWCVASERLTAEPDWREVPEDGVVAVDAELQQRSWRVDDLL